MAGFRIDADASGMAEEPREDVSRADGAARNNRGEATRARILDTAEALFAREGFRGTSLRDIAQRCDVEVGLVSYYFGSKRRLIAEVIGRRAERGERAMLDALDALERGPQRNDPTAIMLAFADTILIPLQRENVAGLNYVRLIVNLQREGAGGARAAGLSSVMQPHYPVRHRYLRALERAFPGVDPASVRFGFEIFEGAFATLLFDSGVDVEDVALRRSRVDLMRRLLVPFCTAGFQAIEAEVVPPRIASARLP